MFIVKTSLDLKSPEEEATFEMYIRNLDHF